MKKWIIGAAVIIVLAAGVYFMYFHRPPTEDILAANKARHTKKSLDNSPRLVKKALQGEHPPGDNGDDDYDYDGEDEESEEDTNTSKGTKQKWEKWIEKNNFVSIGELYNKCENDKDRRTVGKTIMIPDKKAGGLMSRTYVNMTWEAEVTGGEMNIEVKYNGKELYSNHWDVCTVEEGMETRLIHCPIQAGKKHYVKDMKIPNYLPKGRYETKAWVTDQDDKIVGCAFSDFTI